MFLLYLCLFFSFVEESTALKGVYKSPHAKKLAAFLIHYIGNSFLCNKKCHRRFGRFVRTACQKRVAINKENSF